MLKSLDDAKKISILDLAKKLEQSDGHPFYATMRQMTPIDERPEGCIRTQLDVFCGCGWWEHLDEVKKQKAARQARRMGWTFTRKRGWICPACQKEEREKAETNE